MADAYLGDHKNHFSDPGPTYGTYVLDHDNEEFNINTPLATVTAFAAAQSRGRNSGAPMDPSIQLSDSIFPQLTVDYRRTWSCLGRDVRRLILGGLGAPPTVGGISSVNGRVLMADQFPLPGAAPPPSVDLDPTPADALPASDATGAPPTIRVTSAASCPLAPLSQLPWPAPRFPPPL
jgi:hypothetical protein